MPWDEINKEIVSRVKSMPEEKVLKVLKFIGSLKEKTINSAEHNFDHYQSNVSNFEQCITHCMDGLCGEDCPSFNYDECIPPDEKEF